MSKQEFIQKAYGDNWEKVKDFVDENGWLKVEVIGHGVLGGIQPDDLDLKGQRIEERQLLFNPGDYKWRLNSLRGIEFNNNWHQGTPTESGRYHVCQRGVYTGEIIKFDDTDEGMVKVFPDFYSHWRPVEVVPQPIY